MRESTPLLAAGLVAALTLLGGAPSLAMVEAPTIGVDEVRAGMRGYGESVFIGSKSERFEVEVVGVLRDMSPGTSYILARLTGHNLERTGVVAGMSGSPVWLDGRLAGAVAFGWPFAQEAIAGITPIAAMRAIESAAPWGRAPGVPRLAFADLVARRLPADLLSRPLSALAGLGGMPGVGGVGADGRAAVSWGVAGFSAEALGELGRQMPRLAPVALGRSESGAALEPLATGSSVAAVLVDGDLRMAATGTVTERAGDRILAFGHPIFGLGEIQVPMAAAEVVTILGSNYSSFKLANVGDVVGTFERDHAAGNLGRLGAPPPTIPLTIRVATPEPRRFQMRLAEIPALLGILTAVPAIGAVDAATSLGGIAGVDLVLAVELGSQGRLSMRQSFDGDRAALQAIFFAYGVIDFLARTDLAELALERIELDFEPHREPRTDQIVGARVTRSRLAAGESTELVIELRTYRGAIEQRRMPVTVPAGLGDGRYSLLIGDGASVDEARFALEPAAPRTILGALELLSGLGSTHELAVLGIASGRGTAYAGESLPQLPPTLAALLQGAGSGARPLRAAIVTRQRLFQPRPLAGVVRVDLDIVHKRAVNGDAAAPAVKARGRERPDHPG